MQSTFITNVIKRDNGMHEEDIMKEKFNKFYKSSYIPFVILAIVLLIIHIRMKINFGDDIVVKARFMNQGFWTTLVEEYYTWSSPSIPIAIMYVLLLLPQIVFKISNILMVLLAAYSISIITNHTNSKNVNWMIAIFTMLYPFSQMSTAGWIVTSVVYMFPLAFGLYSLIPIKRILYKEKVPYVTSLIALCIGAGSPQLACILAGIYIIFSVYFIIIRNINKFAVLQSILSVAFVIYHLSTPGNKNRTIAETINWFPDFNMITSINKLKLGFTSTLANFISAPNLFFVLFCLLLLVGVFLKYKDTFYRMIASVPLASTLFFGLLSNVTYPVFPKLVGLMNVNMSDFRQITSYNFADKTLYLTIILGTLILGCILLSIYLIFENTLMSLLVNIIFLAGFASRMIMSFSPTLYGSSTRTFIYMYFCIIVCGIFIFDKIRKEIDVEKQYQLFGFIVVITMLNIVESVL